MNHAYGSQRTMMGTGYGCRKPGRTHCRGPLRNTALLQLHSEGKRGPTTHPDLQPTMGHPGQPELLSCPPHRLPDPEATPLGTAEAVGVHAQHFIGAGRGKTNALSAAD